MVRRVCVFTAPTRARQNRQSRGSIVAAQVPARFGPGHAGGNKFMVLRIVSFIPAACAIGPSSVRVLALGHGGTESRDRSTCSGRAAGRYLVAFRLREEQSAEGVQIPVVQPLVHTPSRDRKGAVFGSFSQLPAGLSGRPTTPSTCRSKRAAASCPYSRSHAFCRQRSTSSSRLRLSSSYPPPQSRPCLP